MSRTGGHYTKKLEWDLKSDNELKTLHGYGLGDMAIADHMGCSYKQVAERRSLLGLADNKEAQTTEQIKRIRQLQFDLLITTAQMAGVEHQDEELRRKRANAEHLLDLRIATGKFPDDRTIDLLCAGYKLDKIALQQRINKARAEGIKSTGSSPWGIEHVGGATVLKHFVPEPSVLGRSAAALCME